MKKKFISSFSISALAFAGALSICVQAQTTKEGPGPSEQPSAPMEIGQIKPAQPAQADQPAQLAGSPKLPEEAQPGGPSGEAPAKTTRAWAASA